jgi:nucleotide-binding universal stress UspA family protein
MNAYNLSKILVPIDLSETSLNALDTGIALAKKHKAELQLLHVIDPLADAALKGNPRISPTRTDSNVLSALLGTVEYTHKIRPQLIQVTGSVVESIITTAAKEQTDLVIIGTHGASGNRSGFIGSNAYGTIKYATIPVLTIPFNRKWVSFKKILFPIRAVPGALSHYKVICHFLQAGFSLDVLGLSIRAIDRGTGALDKIVAEIQEQADADKIKLTTHWGSGQSIWEDVLQFAQETYAELIVLTNVVDAVDKPNFIGPHTQRIIHHAKVPVLSIK